MFQHEVLRRHDWLIPTGLLALSFIPMVAGTLRMIQLGSGAAITPESARFVAAPVPVVLHLLSEIAFAVAGLGSWRKIDRQNQSTCGFR
jgi:hypothetical protein